MAGLQDKNITLLNSVSNFVSVKNKTKQNITLSLSLLAQCSPPITHPTDVEQEAVKERSAIKYISVSFTEVINV